MKDLINTPINDDFNNILPLVEDKSIPLIFTDLPFNTTNCRWDKQVPLNDYMVIKNKIYYEKDYILHCAFNSDYSVHYLRDKFNAEKRIGLWTHYNRIIKDDGIILLYAQTPFDKELGMSNKKNLRYEWIYEKTSATGHLNSNRAPMKAHENILVFYKNKPPKVKDFNRTYNPQMTQGHIRKVSSAKNRGACIERRNDTDNIYNNEYADKVKDYDSTERFPRSVQKFKSDKQKSTLHKTQKPLALTEYMIKTYSNEGDIVLDNCAGSFVVAAACNNLKRNWICIEKDEKIFKESIKERKL